MSPKGGKGEGKPTGLRWEKSLEETARRLRCFGWDLCDSGEALKTCSSCQFLL